MLKRRGDKGKENRTGRAMSEDPLFRTDNVNIILVLVCRRGMLSTIISSEPAGQAEERRYLSFPCRLPAAALPAATFARILAMHAHSIDELGISAVGQVIWSTNQQQTMIFSFNMSNDGDDRLWRDYRIDR